jgi:virulence-associated protein VagC
MIAIAKLEKSGNSHIIRLPETFCFEGDEVWVRTGSANNEIILTPKPTRKSLEAFFALLDADPLPEEFLSERIDSTEEPRNLLKI